MPAKRPTRDWSIEEKIRILAKPSTLTGAELSDFLQREGVLQAEYEQWRLALGEDGQASLATVKRIGTLERELARKQEALEQRNVSNRTGNRHGIVGYLDDATVARGILDALVS